MKSKKQTGFLTALAREYEYYRLSGTDLFISVAILLTSMVAVAWIFTTATLTDLPIAVIDNDGTSVSRTYTRMLEATPQMRIVENLSSPMEARELLEQGSVYAVVFIPRDFARDIKSGEQVTIIGWHSGQLLTISGVLSKSLRQVTGTMSAGIEMTSLSKRSGNVLAAQVNYEPIKTELRTLFNPFQNYQYFLVAGLLPSMLQVFVMVWSVFAVGREFRDHTSEEWLASGGTVYAAIAAKIIPIFFISSLVGFGCLNWLYGISGWPVNGSLGLLILAWVLMIFAYLVLGVLCASYAPKLSIGLSFTAFFTAPAFAYAGITFPQQAMPLLAQIWTYALPVRTLLRLQVEQVDLGAPISSSMTELFILSCFVLLPLPFAIYQIKSRCKTEGSNIAKSLGGK
jgi:ABC-2 type transport system permease protein